MPRAGSASSSPTILKLCSRPSTLRRLMVMPKDEVLLSAGGLMTSALARRAFHNGLPAKQRLRLVCRLRLLRRGAPSSKRSRAASMAASPASVTKLR